MNQGWLVAFTMKRVPAAHPFAYGETIVTSIEAAILPRFIWNDKPNAGGKPNLLRFWGFVIYGVSMNIGPLGEAYANFDVNGGIFYMFFYGLFFNYMFSRLLKYSEKRPTISFMASIPVLLFNPDGNRFADDYGRSRKRSYLYVVRIQVFQDRVEGRPLS